MKRLRLLGGVLVKKHKTNIVEQRTSRRAMAGDDSEHEMHSGSDMDYASLSELDSPPSSLNEEANGVKRFRK